MTVTFDVNQIMQWVGVIVCCGIPGIMIFLGTVILINFYHNERDKMSVD